MHSDDNGGVLTTKQLMLRMVMLLAISVGIGMAGAVFGGFTEKQVVASSVFLAIILGTLFFWTFRLSIAFLGLTVLVFTHSLSIESFVASAELPVILFLVGMMIVVGALRDLGFFTWVVQALISIPKMSGRKFIAATSVASALLACAVDEVTSIIFIATLIFQVCNRLKLNPTPYIIICVLCTNIGSAGTMMGNPVGIFIGTKAGLTFGDFFRWAFPIMLVSLGSCVAVTLVWFRKELNLFDERLQERMDRQLSLVPKVVVPYRRGLALLLFTLAFIASHHALEEGLGLDKNSILLVAPLACAGVVMIMKRERARYYVEHEVDWWTLLFFMLLFAIAGTLEHTEVTKVIADGFVNVCGDKPGILIPSIMATTAIGSAFVDNVIFVAAFSPVITALGETVPAMPLWWALLFGACFGGNITLIGSTANIVALGMLEKQSHAHVGFIQWLKIGALSAFIAMLIAWVMLSVMAPYMHPLAGAH
ncbi:SLC13 family permease [Pontiella sp.]|uniref:SLC13 family permease n=2 Tax=Pontiella sp. TaxID=2837462 RepID=UPI003566434C